MNQNMLQRLVVGVCCCSSLTFVAICRILQNSARFLANFDKTIKPIKPLLGVDVNFNTENARSILGYDPIPIEQTIKETSDFLAFYEKG